MKDIRYFLDVEEQWNKEHKDNISLDDPLAFLQYQLFSKSNRDTYALHHNIFGLTEVELFVVACILGTISEIFREDYFPQNPCEITKELRLILDSAIYKVPKYDGTILYRFCHEYDKTDFIQGDIFCPNHSVTTTRDDWRIDTKYPSMYKEHNVYIITPLPVHQTRAHSLYELCDLTKTRDSERQVNFERGTSFRIDRIEDLQTHKLFYMSELLD